jgi:hypothetical protein
MLQFRFFADVGGLSMQPGAKRSGKADGDDAMGFSYRKSVKMGPFRVTASKSGISYSAGVKGARVTKRANGRVQTTLSAPGTGMRYTTTSGAKTRQSRPPVASRAVSRPSPAAAHKAARARKPVRLRGRRGTASPRVPPAGQLPVTINGYLASVSIYQGGIHIERTRAGKVNGNHSSDISWGELVAIDFLKPNFFRNGHVHFATTADPRGLTSTGNGNRLAASARNPHAILFTWQQSRRYRRLLDLCAGTAVPPSYFPAGHGI